MLWGDPDGTHREATSDSLGEGEGVGGDIAMLKCEEFTSPAHAALDFVKEQKGVMLVTQLAQALKKGGRGGGESAFALDGLDEDCGCVLADKSFKAFQVVELSGEKAVEHGPVSVLNLFLRRCGHCAESAPVKSLGGDDDTDGDALFATGFSESVQAGEFEQGFVGFGSAVTKKHSPCLAICSVWVVVVCVDAGVDGLGEAFLEAVAEEVACLGEQACLALDGGDPVWMSVAQRIAGDAHAKIEVAPSCIVPDVGAFAAGEGEGGRCIITQQARCLLRGREGGSSGIVHAFWEEIVSLREWMPAGSSTHFHVGHLAF